MKKPKVPAYRCQKAKSGDRAFVELSGRRIYLGAYGTEESTREYDRVLAEWRAGGRHLPVDTSVITVVELTARFWTWCQEYYRHPDGTQTGSADSFKYVIKPLKLLYATRPVSEFGPKALKAVREWMVQQDWSRKCVNQQIGRVRQIFRWGVEEELVPAAVYQALLTVSGLKRGRCAARETGPVRPVPDALIDAIKPHVSRQVWALIQLQLLTAARPGELVNLRPVDLNTSELVWTWTLDQHKTSYQDRERTIYFGPRAQEIIAPFLSNRPVTSYLFSAAEAEEEFRAAKHASRKTPLGYGNRPGTNNVPQPKRRPADCYTADSYRRAIIRACERAKIPTWHPYQLRHNAATRLRSQFGLEVSQVMLGHADADVTQIYAEVDRKRAVQIAEKVG